MPIAAPQWSQDVWDNAFIDYVKAQRQLDQQLASILRGTAAEARGLADVLAGIDQVSAHVRSLQLNASSQFLDRLSGEMWPRIEDTVGSSLIEASDIAIEAQSSMLRQLISMGIKTGRARQLAESFVEAARQAAENVRSRIINAIPLSRDVVRNTKVVRGWINERINTGIALNKSAREIAHDVVDLINPNTPGGASYAAMRIGRTELNNAFHTTTARAVADHPWVDGVQWILSDSHPRPDECNAYAQDDHAGLGAGIFTRDSVPGKPHPQCLCYLTVVTVDPEQFANQLLSGRYNRFLVSHGQSPLGT
jgi:hypothetical protein